MIRQFALVDCNNFFVSCERVFRPDLRGRPAVVLSNNDGCVVARSNEVKALGVPMAIPYFKVEKLLAAHKTVVFSANFRLYGDFSRRVVESLYTFTPRVEVYSVDESFLDVPPLMAEDLDTWAQSVHDKIGQWTGIPVSVGIGPTKTLAKLAAERAKKSPDLQGALNLADPHQRDPYLKQTPVGDIWGIGRALGPKLNRLGIKTAFDLIQLPDQWLHKELTIQGLRTVKELRGESCIGLGDTSHFDQDQKSLAATRSFPATIWAMHELESAVATFCARGAAKLRRKHQIAAKVRVFIQTGAKAPKAHYPSIQLNLPYPTSDTGTIIHTALKGLEQIYDGGFGYKRAGIILTELSTEADQQLPLFGPSSPQIDRRQRAMQAIDTLNHRYGGRTVVHGAEGVSKQAWHSRRRRQSQAYTTSWYQLPVAKAT